jgi:peptide/nickel transport system ATP-binding protein
MPVNSSAVLEARGLSYGYQKGDLLFENLSLRVAAGQRVVLVGPSGCGKSTFAKVLAGYLEASSGEVIFGREPIFTGKTVRKKRGERGPCPIQLIYQHPEEAVNPRWKLRQTLNEAWDPPADFFEQIGIQSQWLDRYPRELSGGELQRFCIARALAPETRFLIADEISTMLDVLTQAQMWGFILAELKRRNMGLLAITHDLELAKRIGTSIIKFEDLVDKAV